MACTKGSLGRKTRAALYEAEHGKLEKAASSTLSYLSRIVTGPKRDDHVRMQAANILLPYLRPKLSAVEQTNISPEEQQSEADITAKMAALLEANPEFLTKVLAMQKTEPEEPIPDEQIH